MSKDMRDSRGTSAAALLTRRQAGPIDRDVGARIALERRRRGMSSDDLGRRLGFTVVQMKKYEHGRSRIPVGTLCAVSEILDVPMARLLPDERPSPRHAAERREDIARTLRDIPDAEVLRHLHALLRCLVRGGSAAP